MHFLVHRHMLTSSIVILAKTRMTLPSQSSRAPNATASRAPRGRGAQLLKHPLALSALGVAGVSVAWFILRASGTNEAHAAVPSDLSGVTTSPPRTALEETLDVGPAVLRAAPIVAMELVVEVAIAPLPITPALEPAIEPPAPVATPPVATPQVPTNRAGNGFDTATPTRTEPATPATVDSLQAQLKSGHDLAATQPVEARRLLSTALLSGQLTSADARLAADTLNAITQQIFFTPVFNANDSTCTQYKIQSGDALTKIVKREKIACDWRLVKRINNLKSESSIREGQRLKLPRGTFHAFVSKRDYRVDLVLDNGSERVVIACFPVGLGSANGTPLGHFRVRPQSKLVNPEWTHPVTGEHYAAEDPKNPIGEHWLGLEGVDATNRELVGYGMHGTVDPSSIGQDMSLGCVRMLDTDIAIVWECLTEPNSIIEIK